MYFKKAFVIFLLFYLLFMCIGYKEEIDTYAIVMQIVIALSSFGYASFMLKNEGKDILLLTFLFQLVLSVGLRLVFISYDKVSIFGNDPDNDALGYFQYALLANYKTIGEYKYFLENNYWGNIDDFGYTFYLFFIHKVMSQDIALWLVIVLNAFLIACSANFLYKTCEFYNKNRSDDTNSRIIATIFSTFTFFVDTSATGRKEDLFMFFIAGAFYYMVKYQRTRTMTDLFWFGLFGGFTIFFRTAVTFIIVVSFILGVYVKERNKKLYTFILLGTAFLGPIMINIIAEKVLGKSMDEIYNIAESRYNSAGNNSYGKKMGDIAASIVGPFPNYTYFKDTLFFSYSSLLKMLLNLPVWATIFWVIKNMKIEFYSVASCVVLGVVMLALTGTGLDLRYHIPFFVPFLLVFAVFLNFDIVFPKKQVAKVLYMLMCLFLIYLYNQR